jgi:hypothetical protein
MLTIPGTHGNNSSHNIRLLVQSLRHRRSDRIAIKDVGPTPGSC